ncbi:Hypothetical protein NTJ_10252 [Nesidiocoris tenuis]|uniref:Uncharacterized protein n=1 Tax=Nesidiocoris tenuis TaxID=355587 RepID=A0ABN7AZ46_9HEMI|nr:Hypothetical protein NTJ_10252 [Nesidiocoris tenuis]
MNLATTWKDLSSEVEQTALHSRSSPRVDWLGPGKLVLAQSVGAEDPKMGKRGKRIQYTGKTREFLLCGSGPERAIDFPVPVVTSPAKIGCVTRGENRAVRPSLRIAQSCNKCRLFQSNSGI